MKPWILGISASHNGAFCLLHGNEISVAIQEERLIGVKRARVYGARRSLGLNYCLQTAGISASDLSMVVLSCQRSARDQENDIWLHPDLSGLTNLRRQIVPHHLSHAASAFATSGYDRAAILTVDGLGSPVDDLCDAARRVVVHPCEGASEHLSLFRAQGNNLTPIEVHATQQWLDRDSNEMWLFHSLGGMYSAVAQQIFGDPMEAGKVMGLAAYGTPRIPVEDFLEFDSNCIHFTNRVQRRFRHQDRWPSHKRTYEDLAASVQRALEIALLHITAHLYDLTHESNLCLAGGVALNSVANQRICQETNFDRVFIVPFAEDSGVAVGAAYLGLWQLSGISSRKQIRTDSLGRPSTASEIASAIQAVPDIVARRPLDLLEEAANRLSQGQIGGWFQAGSELGPRALGQRSIVCSPCGTNNKSLLNRRVKFREPFRPFAPAVLATHAVNWFDFGETPADSPFMLRVAPFRPGYPQRVPAVVHVDGSGRVQTLTPEDNGLFYKLVEHFYSLTGVPMLLNTSMNVQGEPIVETAVDALWCLLGTGLDFCIIHDWLITKSEHFRTVLDYVPGVVAESYTLRMAVADHSLRRLIDREDSVTLHTTTPWGVTDTLLPLRLLPLLSRIDGSRNGHALLDSTTGNPRAENLLRDLLLLRRMHLIRFLNADVSCN